MTKAKSEFVVQMHDGKDFYDTGYGDGCTCTADCVSAIKDAKVAGKFRIIAVAKHVTATVESIEKVTIS